MNLVASLDHLRRTSRSRMAVAIVLTGLFLVPLQVSAGATTPGPPTTVDPGSEECELGDPDCELVPCEEGDTDPDCEWVPCEEGDPDCEWVPCEEGDTDPECDPEVGEPTTTTMVKPGTPPTTAKPKPSTDKPKPKPSTDKPVPAKPNFTG